MISQPRFAQLNTGKNNMSPLFPYYELGNENEGQLNSQSDQWHPVRVVTKSFPDVEDVGDAPEGTHGENQAILDPQEVQWRLVDGIDWAQGKMELESHFTLR